MMRVVNGNRHATVTEDAIKGFFGEYRVLSNFHPVRVVLDDIEFPSSEHAYMACKTTSLEERRLIASLANPVQAKRYGRAMVISTPDWDVERLPSMLRVLVAKFRNEECRAVLLGTGARYLEETNNWGDRFWGVDGFGLNNLGRLLMLLRDTHLLLEPKRQGGGQLSLI